MRTKRLRKRGNAFIAPPQETRRNKLNWGKFLYLAILLTAVGFSLRWGYQTIFYISGFGFLESEITFVEARAPGRILAINCNINDEVSVGEPLVVLANPVSAHLNGNEGAGYTNERKIIDVESKINLLHQEIKQAIEKAAFLQEEYERAHELLALKAITRPQFLHIQNQLRTAENDLAIWGIKLDTEEKTLVTYQKQMTFASQNGHWKINRVAGNRFESILKAAEAGTVSMIFKQKGEVTRTGEPVLKIVNKNKNFIKAYFAGEYEKLLKAGSEVIVNFENGETSIGIIKKIYPTALDQPNGIKRRFGSVQRYLIVEVVPKNAEYWDRILETQVKVLVKKSWL